MTEDAVATAEATPRLGRRMRDGVRRGHNWLQLIRFGLVGASGYVVNLIVFTVLVHGVDVNYRLAATGAFLVAVANNFYWNRHWTFRARDGHAGFQAARFLTVSVVAFAFNLLILEILVAGLEVAEVPAQAMAIIAATPLSFLGNKLWSFAQ